MRESSVGEKVYGRAREQILIQVVQVGGGEGWEGGEGGKGGVDRKIQSA